MRIVFHFYRTQPGKNQWISFGKLILVQGLWIFCAFMQRNLRSIQDETAAYFAKQQSYFPKQLHHRMLLYLDVSGSSSSVDSLNMILLSPFSHEFDLKVKNQYNENVRLKSIDERRIYFCF